MILFENYYTTTSTVETHRRIIAMTLGTRKEKKKYKN